MGATQEVYCDLEEIQDEELVSKARDGSEVALEALINKYKNFVRAKARSYFWWERSGRYYSGRNDRSL